MESSLRKVDSVLEEVDKKMEEFQDWVNYVKPNDMTTEIPMEIVNSPNELIQDSSPVATIESVHQSGKELKEGVLLDCQAADHVRSVKMDLQEKVDITKFMNSTPNNLEYCDKIEIRMDQAQTWCLIIEDLYNKTEVHSIKTSKGDVADVGNFSDNSQITVFVFLEAVELAYLGWGVEGQQII